MAIISATSAIDRTILVLFWLSAVLVINLPSQGGEYRISVGHVQSCPLGSNLNSNTVGESFTVLAGVVTRSLR